MKIGDRVQDWGEYKLKKEDVEEDMLQVGGNEKNRGAII